VERKWKRGEGEQEAVICPNRGRKKIVSERKKNTDEEKGLAGK